MNQNIVYILARTLPALKVLTTLSLCKNCSRNRKCFYAKNKKKLDRYSDIFRYNVLEYILSFDANGSARIMYKKYRQFFSQPSGTCHTIFSISEKTPVVTQKQLVS